MCVAACYRPALVTVEVRMPQLVSHECAEQVMAALNALEADALREVGADIDRQVMTITYDPSRLALKNIEHALARAGFDANEIAADPDARARLPAPCR